MITARSQEAKYQVAFSNGTHSALADTTEDKGGGNSGFRPHDLLEASLAACLTMWLKMYADHHGYAVGTVETTVSIDRSQAEESIFTYSIEISGELSEAEKDKLLKVARTCAVHKTLSKKISFRQG